MPHLAPVRTASGVVVDAPLDTLWPLLTELAHLPALSPAVLHIDRSPAEGNEDRITVWTVTPGEQVWSCTSRRTFDRAAGRIEFTDVAEDDAPAGVRGHWQLTDAGQGRTEIQLAQEVDDPENAERYEYARQALLTAVADAAQRRTELADLIVDFADPLYVAGAAEDAYRILYEADKWPERLPHVSRIAMTEDVPNVQFFDMDTTTQDNRPHTTRSVRLCFPHGLIVYKQIGLPPLLAGHTGHWRFTPERDGLIVEARHTAVIKPEALHLLGEGSTVEDGRRYLRKVLSTNSMTNLRLAKEYAEAQSRA